MSRTEIPVQFEDWSTVHDLQRPWSPLQALMETRPHDEPRDSVKTLQPLREVVAACVDRLAPQDRFILEATHVERITVRALADRLGLHKSYTHRLIKRAELRLRDDCLTEPQILAYLGLAGAIVSAAVLVPDDDSADTDEYSPTELSM